MVEDMTWITYDVAKKLMTDFCKSFCFCGTQFGTFTAMDECFNQFFLSPRHVCETDPSAQLDVELSTHSQREQLSPISSERRDPVDSVCRS